MPFTPFHYPIALMLHKLNKNLILPALIVASFFPDLEVPFLMIFFQGILPDHLLFHSLIGAITLGTIISSLVTIYLYPSIVSFLFKIERKKLEILCKPSKELFISCLLGNLFHIFLDVIMHPVNPIFWPWINPENVIGPFVLLFSDSFGIDVGFLIANITSNLIMGIIGIIIIVHYRKNLWEKLLVGNRLEFLEIL